MSKSFTELRQKLNESAGRPTIGATGAIPAADDVDVNISDVADPKILNRINHFLSAMSHRTYLNPLEAVRNLRVKLWAVSLSFDEELGPTRYYKQFEGEQEGEYIFKLKRWGGRLVQGVDGSVSNDDGISHQIPGGLFLKMTVTNEVTGFAIDVKICTEEEANATVEGE